MIIKAQAYVIPLFHSTFFMFFKTFSHTSKQQMTKYAVKTRENHAFGAL